MRSHSGITSNSQSGRSSSRSIGGLALGQFRLVPGALSATVRGERTRQSTRRNQAGPTTRSDVLTNGGENTSAFGGALRLDVDVTMTTRERTARRALTQACRGRTHPTPCTSRRPRTPRRSTWPSRTYGCSPRPRSPWTPPGRTG